jgi:hypothetical protein
MVPTSTPFSPAAPGEGPNNESRSNGLSVNPQRTPANTGSQNGSFQANPAEKLNAAPSPILMVSNYSRGDSPARSGFRMARSPSKRGRTGQTSNHLAPANHYSSEDEEDALQQDDVQHASSHVERTDDGSWQPNALSGRTGIDPTARGDAYVPSLKEIDERQQLEEKNAEVASWLENSEAGSELAEEDGPAVQQRGRKSSRPKRRSQSTGARIGATKPDVVDDSAIPGPGALIDEDSEAASTEDSGSYASMDIDAASPPAEVDVRSRDIPQGYFPAVEEIPPEQEEPLPRQFISARPWQDQARGPVLDGTMYQPTTSNAAMYKYDQLAAKWETASRAATWGTRRRLSEADIQSIVSGQSVRKLSIAQKTRERGNSFVRQAVKLMPGRSNSNSKKKDINTQRDNPSTESVQKIPTDAISSFKPLQRVSSVGKSPKPPHLDTGNALLAMTSQITAVGRSTSATPDTGGFPSGSWKALKRQRSKSEIPRTKTSDTPGLAELMTNHGGPPVPTLVSPMQERPLTEKRHSECQPDDEGVGEDGEEVSNVDEGAKIDHKVKVDHMIPNLDGFRSHAKQVNPRLELFLTERIAMEQVRRYKKLVENKIKHIHAVKNLKQCSSGGFCYELGGEAKDLPPRTSTKDPETMCAQFQVPGNGDSDGEANTFAEGIVTAALFPPGIPLPPVKRLPAELECSLCFKVKKFQKPSDWTKHVHEDVQPFTCTFADCSEGKSFKRKADWVRHENERHRRLEGWRCNVPECNHVCWRKDNFVQHLVREHKKREPQVKSRGSTGGRAPPATKRSSASYHQVQEDEIEEVWKLVEVCHFETQKKPSDEVCKFCGNVCNSWKKLTVHLAKHMEHIAMPVLELVKRREVSHNTIVSPVEQSNRAHRVPSPASQEARMKAEPNSLSPFAMGTTPQAVALQATQSPGAHSQDSHYAHSMHNSPSLSHTSGSAYDAQVAMQPPSMAQFVQMHDLPANMSYGPYQHPPLSPALIAVNSSGSGASTYPPPFNVVRRSPQQVAAHVSRSHPGLVPVDPMFDVPPQQQQVYSSPTDTGPYDAQFGVGMDQMHNYTASTMAYDQRAMSAEMAMPQNVVYDAQHHSAFQANPPPSHSYPYTPQ